MSVFSRAYLHTVDTWDEVSGSCLCVGGRLLGVAIAHSLQEPTGVNSVGRRQAKCIVKKVPFVRSKDLLVEAEGYHVHAKIVTSTTDVRYRSTQN